MSTWDHITKVKFARNLPLFAKEEKFPSFIMPARRFYSPNIFTPAMRALYFSFLFGAEGHWYLGIGFALVAGEFPGDDDFSFILL
jgi:hypothetical protein